MLTVEIARKLRTLGLQWQPESGDRFLIDKADLDGQVFTVSELTVEPHKFDTGTILGFNGTTEWALDSVAIEGTLWLPREDQLRSLLGSSFRRLEHSGSHFVVVVEVPGREELLRFEALTAADAYGWAVVAFLETEANEP